MLNGHMRGRMWMGGDEELLSPVILACVFAGLLGILSVERCFF